MPGLNTSDSEVHQEGWKVAENPVPLHVVVGKQPYRCPVCGGNGLVPPGYYDQTSGQWSTTTMTGETCRSCWGTGVVWG